MSLRRLCPRLLPALVFLLLIPAAFGGDNRFWFASQQDFGAQRGFDLVLENAAPGDAPCRLSTLRLILGVADGRSWRFPSLTPAWVLGRDYTVKAVIGSKEATLQLDGETPLHSPGGFSPTDGDLLSRYVPEWAAAPAEYDVVQTSMTLQTSGGGRLTRAFPVPPPNAAPLRLFERRTPPRRDLLALKAGETLTVRATFRLVPAPTDFAGAARRAAPLVDRYGQATAAEWPDKVRSDADLKRPIADEDRRYRQWGPGPARDRWGGDLGAGWHERPSGFYRTVKRGGFWWLLSPDGNPCFYTGLCTAPALDWEKTPVTGRESLFADLPPRTAPYSAAWGRNVWGDGSDADWVALRAATLIRKYGADWKAQATRSTQRRLHAWGFSGMAKWCNAPAGTPDIAVLGSGGVPKLARHADIFDPAVQAQFRDALGRQILPRRADPFLVGWSLGNEYDEIITPDEIDQILQKPADVPAKRALVDHALQTLYGGDLARLTAAWKTPATTVADLYAAKPAPLPAEDRERLRQFYADRYYAFVYDTVKGIDPNHLYLGFWIVPGWWVGEEDWRLIAPHCDVIGYDNYAYEFADPSLRRLMRQTDKPVLCGEFSFPPDYDGRRGFGVYKVWADDEADAGRLYAGWMWDAARNPECVGVCWFQYRDEPLTGRGPGQGPEPVYGEHYAFGLVDESDRPKWPLVERVRAANLGADAQRLRAAAAPGAPPSTRSAPHRPAAKRTRRPS